MTLLAGERRSPYLVDNDDNNPRTGLTSPRVFISHDTRDAELAEAFSKLLSGVSAGVLKSFRSSDRSGSQGIDYGTEWYPELMNNLDSASDVVCLLTEKSIDRPWLLYEAGVAKGKLSTKVYGIALGIPLSRASSGPFAQFQNCDDATESLTKLVMQLVSRIPSAEPDHDAILMQVESFRARIANYLETSEREAGNGTANSNDAETSVAKLFEEVKVMFQDLPHRIDSRLSDQQSRFRRKRRFHPMMMEEILHFGMKSDDGTTGILIALSVIRDDFPWLYELGLDFRRLVITGETREAIDAGLKLQRLMEMVFQGAFLDELRYENKEDHILFRELPRMVDRLVASCMSSLDQSVRSKALEEDGSQDRLKDG